MAALGPESAPTAIIAEKAEVESTVRPLESTDYPQPNGVTNGKETNGVVANLKTVVSNALPTSLKPADSQTSSDSDSRLKAVEERLRAAEERIKELEAKLLATQPASESTVSAVQAVEETPAATLPTESVTEKLAATLTFDVDEIKKRYTAERDKRLRADGNEQYKEFKGQFSHYLTDPYVPRKERDVLDIETDFLVLGGGFGGLSLAAELVKAGVNNFKIMDKAGDFGGTWYWNRYPGAACDIGK
jgi:hypothetical protein